jgi:acetoin utilization protein AcuB
MKARDVMTRFPKTIEVGDDVALAAQMMAWAQVRHLPVVRSGKLAGLLTERDVVVHLARTGAEGRLTPVDEVMTPTPQTAGPDDAVTEIAARMAEYRIGCLPVVETGSLIGVVTTTDVLRSHVRAAMSPEQPPSGRTVGDVMTSSPLTAFEDDYLLDAAARMVQHRIRHLPVINGDRRVLGMISDRDVRGAIGDPGGALQVGSRSPKLELLRVRDAMTRPAITTSSDRDCAEVAREFVSLAASALPVVDEKGTLLGILSYVDVLRGLTAS